MKMIKNFIYLDEDKMFSISAQISGGRIESMMVEDNESYTEVDKQVKHETTRVKKNISTNDEVMENILRTEISGQKHKILHDFSYSIFEQEIANIIIDVNENNIKKINNANFVRIKSRPIFIDISKIIHSAEHFNTLYKAILSFYNMGSSQPNANKKTKSQEHFNNKMLKDLSMVLEYGYQNQFKIVMEVGDFVFEADCNRSYFRDDEYSLIRKYSRFPEIEFVLVGMVTQNHGKSNTQLVDESYVPVGMKENIMQTTKALSDLESQFSDKSDNEIIIEPIALYIEIPIPDDQPSE